MPVDHETLVDDMPLPVGDGGKDVTRQGGDFMIDGHRHRLRIVANISPREWPTVQAFAQRAEMDYQIADELQSRPALKDHGFTPGDHIKLLSEGLQDAIATFSRMVQTNGKPMIEAEMQIMGRAVKVRARPDQVIGVASPEKYSAPRKIPCDEAGYMRNCAGQDGGAMRG